MTGSIGQVYVSRDFNVNDPNHMRRCIKPSNVVISMAGPSYRDTSI